MRWVPLSGTHPTALTVIDIDPSSIDALIGHLQRGMRLTAMIQDTELQLMSDTLNVALTPRVRMKTGVGI